MTTFPKITIITPSYNQAQYIEQTIDSVLSQNYPNLEYMIFDGGSKDNSAEIIARYSKHLAHWESQPDKGQTDAINKGLQRATGEIINWLNSDDYYEPKSLFTIAEAFQRTQARVVCAKSRIFQDQKPSPSGEGLGGATLFHSNGTDIYQGNLPKTIGWARIDQPETFFRRDSFDKIGLIDVRFRYLMDRDLWIKYLLHFGLNEIVHIPDVVVHFRHHQDSKTVSQQDFFGVERNSLFWGLAVFYKCEAIAEFLQENFEVKQEFQFTNFPSIDKRLAEEFLHYHLLLIAEELYVKRHHKQARKVLRFIDKSCLQSLDLALYKKVKFRNLLRAWL